MKFLNAIKIFVLIGILLATSCRKDEITTDKGAMLSFSTDTVYFDTILTTFGSVTQRFKIYNDNDQNIVISELYLGGGISSPYRLNVDGVKGNSHKGIEIRKKDSLYVFVEVTIDPLNSNSPLLVTDSVVCITNGNQQNVKLVSYGQDINLFSNEIIKSQTWTAEKPYLIFKNVKLDSGEVLTIEPGVQIFLLSYSSLLIYGKLEAKGTYDNPIIFKGARFDDWYENAAGQWGTLYFDPMSKGNKLEYVTIKNANAGMQVGYPERKEGPTIELTNCMILNSASYAIMAYNATINSYNTVIADCGQSMILITMGGEYKFYHLTASNYSAYYPNSWDYNKRSSPSLVVTNYYNWWELDDYYKLRETVFCNDLNLSFYNSIIYGSLKTEVALFDTSNFLFNYKFDHCILKNTVDSFEYRKDSKKTYGYYSDLSHFNELILNKDPFLINDSIAKAEFDFRLDTLSPAKDTGDINLIMNIPQLQTDYAGNSRTIDGKPDLGAFERNE
jgi:hypothetical protein